MGTCAVLGAASPVMASAASLHPILTTTRHLGVANQPEWSVFAGRQTDGTNLVVTFDTPPPANADEHTLFIRQDDVKQDWTVTLNGRRLGQLFLMEAPLVHTLPVPAGIVKEKDNRLEISSKAAEDILIHEISISPSAKAALFSAHPVTISVRELGSGNHLPARITIADALGHLATFHDFGAINLATRPGVVYTADGRARLGLLPGEYTIHASRGSEYGMEQATIAVPRDTEVELAIGRQVDTAGWLAADPHIHTVSLSKHGDATLAERVITIAGEGIELPIATEHNLHADYTPAAQRFGVAGYFTAVPGNEVTTKKGHFNIFPVSLSAPPPDHTIESWPELLERIRAMPEVQVAILNHPTDIHGGFTPFAATNLNLVSGRNLRGDFPFNFDAMEVINSGAMRSDWMEPFRAWFALLNRGQRVTAVAASDSHDVSRFIVGQGRTYIRGDDSDPGKIDVQKACENLKLGRAVVSLGLFTGLAIRDADSTNAAAGPGDLHSARGTELEFKGTFAAPDWMSPRRAVIYANGRHLAEYRFEGLEGKPKNVDFRFRLPKPKHDTHYTLIARGPGVTNQFWAVARPYQPTSKDWEPAIIGATNPVWVDADNDGKFSYPRDYAKRLVDLPREELSAELEAHDWAVATQVADLLHEKGEDLKKLQTSLAPAAREAFDDYLKSLPE
jgi:hypothetical protein